jgi:thymidylate synthase
MRSSDAWLGWVYDVFNFSCLSMWIVLALRQKGIDVKLGSLTLQAGSQHLYESNWDKVDKIISKFAARHTMNDVESFEVAPVDLNQFNKPDDLVEYLKIIADLGKAPYTTNEYAINWLHELPHCVKWSNSITWK